MYNERERAALRNIHLRRSVSKLRNGDHSIEIVGSGPYRTKLRHEFKSHPAVYLPQSAGTRLPGGAVALGPRRDAAAAPSYGHRAMGGPPQQRFAREFAVACKEYIDQTVGDLRSEVEYLRTRRRG